MDCSTPGFPVHHQPQEPTQTHVHHVGVAIQHLILCCPLLLPPLILPSIRVFSNESALCIRWPKYWSPSSIFSGLISFRIDWFDILAVQGIFKGLLQHHNLRSYIKSEKSLTVVMCVCVRKVGRYMHIFSYDSTFPLNFQSPNRGQETWGGPPLLESWSGCHFLLLCQRVSSFLGSMRKRYHMFVFVLNPM